MQKDWTGNSVSNFKTLGATNHSLNQRETNDYYATEPKALDLLLKLEQFDNVWECACGEGHLSEVLKLNNIHGKSTDLIDRNYGDGVFDFLSIENQSWNGDIITNPPYKYAKDFILRAMSIMVNGRKLALFLPIRYLEGKARKQTFISYPPKTIYVSSSRLICAMNGDFKSCKGSCVSYAWFIWEKGHKGITELKWFN